MTVEVTVESGLARRVGLHDGSVHLHLTCFVLPFLAPPVSLTPPPIAACPHTGTLTMGSLLDMDVDYDRPQSPSAGGSSAAYDAAAPGGSGAQNLPCGSSSAF